MTKLTLKDVSREAGVSVALVSAVLNRATVHIRASDETAKRIKEIAARLGYVPNNNARGLKMSRSFLIGVCVYDINTSFVPDILAGCEDFFIKKGYGMLLSSAAHDNLRFIDNIEMFHRRGVDGMLLIPGMNVKFGKMPETFNEIPKVFIASSYNYPNSASVYVDGEAVGYLAATELLKRGHKYIGFLNNFAGERRKGWFRALAEAGIEPETSLIVKCRNYFDEAVEVTVDFLKRHSDVTAIFADSDISAAGALRAARELGRRIAVIGVDDSPICKMHSPELASIGFPKIEHGALAAKQLDLLLQGKPAENIVMLPEFKCRESVEIH